MQRKPGRTLSKGLLNLKFMKKSRDKFEREVEETESRTMYASSLTTAMLFQENRFIIESSHVLCENLIPGRLSFGGINPEIELIMASEEEQVKTEIEENQTKDVSDKEMAHHYSELVSTLKKKFNKSSNQKEQRRDNREKPYEKNKYKFMKPKDV